MHSNMLRRRMYTVAPTGKTRQQLYRMLFDKATRSSLTNPYEQQAYQGPRQWEVRAIWEQYRYRMRYYMDQREPQVLDIKELMRAFRNKDQEARAEINEYMKYCAKRWQTREGRYQIKRQRLLPDVRDEEEPRNDDVSMRDT